VHLDRLPVGQQHCYLALVLLPLLLLLPLPLKVLQRLPDLLHLHYLRVVYNPLQKLTNVQLPLLYRSGL
jgi:hypothetical protein